MPLFSREKLMLEIVNQQLPQIINYSLFILIQNKYSTEMI